MRPGKFWSLVANGEWLMAGRYWLLAAGYSSVVIRVPMTGNLDFYTE
jgi:hypothetical protein